MLLQPVDGRDVGMIEGGKRPRFTLEARQPIRIGPKRGRQHLERDVAAQPAVVGAIDLAHPADADDGGDLIRPESSTSECHVSRGIRRDYMSRVASRD